MTEKDRTELLSEIERRGEISSRGWREQARRMMRGPVGAVAAFLLVLLVGLPLVWLSGQLADPTVEGTATYRAPGVVTAIDTGGPPAGPPGVRAFVVDGNTIWLASSPEHLVYQIDRLEGSLVSRHPIGSYAEGVVVGADALWLGGYGPEAVVRIEPGMGPLGGDRVTRHPLPAAPAGMVWAADLLWVITEEGDLVRLAEDGFPFDRVDRVDRGGPGSRFMIEGFGSVWVASEPNGRVLRLDPGTGRVTTSIEVGGSPRAMAVHDGRLWVTDTERGRLVEIDPVAEQVTATIEIGGVLHSIASLGASLWVSDFEAGTIVEVDPDGLDVVRVVALSGRPASLEAADGTLWVSLYRAGRLLQLDPSRQLPEVPQAGLIDRVVEVGEGRAVRLRCVGEGGPTVLLEATTGEGAASWATVQAMLSRNLRVCASDRSGTWKVDGYQPAPLGELAARDLWSALEQANEVGPFLLVGHGRGAFVSRELASAHPDAVAGMVLVDPQPDDYIERFLEVVPQRLVGEAATRFVRPVEAELALRAGIGDEPVPTVPVVVLGHDPEQGVQPGGEIDGDTARALRNAWQEGLAVLTERLGAEVTTVEGASHWIIYERPDVVVEAVLNLRP